MKILLINNDTKRLEEFRELLKGDTVEIITHREAGKVDPTLFHLVILSGSSVNSVIGNSDIYDEELQFIRKVGVPIIGICLGFQLIVKAFGGHIRRRSGKIQGWNEIEAVREDSLFEGNKHFTVYESHRWIVTELSPAFDGLAHSNYGWEFVKHKEKPIYGVQFHPEVGDEEHQDGKKLFKNMLRDIVKK